MKQLKHLLSISFLLIFLLNISFGQANQGDTTMTLTAKEKKIILGKRDRNIDLGNSTTTEVK